MVPIAPVECLGFDLISLLAVAHLSGKEAIEFRLLLVADCGDVTSEVSGVEKWVSMKDRKYRFALSRGPASFTVKYDLLEV